MGIEDLLQGKREEILRLAAHHGAENLRVFGSVARGEAKAEVMWTSLLIVARSSRRSFPAGY